MFRFKIGDKVLLNDGTFTIADRIMRYGQPMYELRELPGEYAEHLFKSPMAVSR